MRTRLELETAPNSAIGTIGRLLSQWELFARKVEELARPTKDELILWRLVYNWHQETEEEFETTEMPPIPLIFGKVTMVASDTFWEIGHCPYIIEFNCVGLMPWKLRGGYAKVSDEKLPADIVRWLRDKSVV